jgi:16S rRNA (guanine966-N2)-methyltransferase
LRVPPGDAVRPATDGMRQAVFSSLAARVPGARFFDLFAGSGAYGLEALSRGAAGGVFVEKNAKAVACLRANLAAVCKSLGRAERDAAVVLPLDLLSAPLAAQPAPDLVFVDPPYAIIEKIAPALFAQLTELLKAKDDPVIVFEMPGELTLTPPGWTCVKRLGKGRISRPFAFSKKPQPGLDERDGGDHGGFGAQHAGAEMDQRKSIRAQERPIAGRPAALRTERQHHRRHDSGFWL